MKGLYLEQGSLEFRQDLPEPATGGDGRNLVLVEPLRAGICATDIALSRGYMGFCGIPGHEFVGIATAGRYRGRRVVGDINAACGRADCAWCQRGDGHHCPDRTVLGILRHGGAFAERLALPEVNLLPVPEGVSTDAATFTEPLAAALEIPAQLRDLGLGNLDGGAALVAGDGKLGLLCAWALRTAGMSVTVAGRHPERRELLPGDVEFQQGLLEPDADSGDLRQFDLAVEATGSPHVLARLCPLVRPRGILVLKTTTEQPVTVDLAPVVVNELLVLGSRCGPFQAALDLLAEQQLPVEDLVHARFPLADGVAAFARAQQPGTLKVLLEFGPR